ncbi:hypothetical protein [Natronorubrum tibetense]|uniref:Uncharacterized protein n=1 Tax=Natronorubrum tibetense GA33 TaxID=1114856 RepID=L9VLX9_9EURY|nr:hypothetical protein [Natronorubrum tibetense]ELY38215.1 hypothetical protein C496_18288 [Natronorubrum tibetense GA33]
MDSLSQLWKRYVARNPDPDAYRVYASFPSRPSDGPPLGALRDRIDDLEYAFGGRLDVTVTRKRMVVTTDTVAIEQFDRTAFERFVAGIENLYGDVYDVVHYTKSRQSDHGFEKSHVLVPVKPLFSKPNEPAGLDRVVSGDQSG